MRLSTLGFTTLLLLALASEHCLGASAAFIGEVRATNDTGRLVTPTNFFTGNILAGNNITLERTNKTGIVIHGSASGGGVSATNANQFGASPVLTVKSGALLTNLHAVAFGSDAVPLTVAAAAGQDANLLNFTDDGGDILANFGYDGTLTTTALIVTNVHVYSLSASKLVLSSGTKALASSSLGEADLATQSDLSGASNVLRSAFVANDTTTSNGLVTLLVANDTTTSNALRTDLSNLQGGTNGLNTRVGNLEGASNLFYNGESSLTNARTVGLVYDRLSGTNRLRSVAAGYGLLSTNESTNVIHAIDPAVVASQGNLTAESNVLRTAVSDLQSATNQFGNTNRFIASDGGKGTNNELHLLTTRGVVTVWEGLDILGSGSIILEEAVGSGGNTLLMAQDLDGAVTGSSFVYDAGSSLWSTLDTLQAGYVLAYGGLTVPAGTLNGNGSGITNLPAVNNTAFQPAAAAISNLVGTVARNVTNVVSLSTTNATSKPLTNAYTAGVLTLFGLEAGANTTLTPNGSNIVIASTASGGGISTNANQFGASTTLSLKDGLLATNLNHYGLASLRQDVIGTTSPYFRLMDTNGNIVFRVDTNNVWQWGATSKGLIVSNSVTEGAATALITSNSVASTIFQTTAGVGIGTNAPKAVLAVAGPNSNTIPFSVSGVFGQQTNLIEWGTNGIVSGAVKSNGTILLPSGTAGNPSYAFKASDDGTGTGLYMRSADVAAISINGTERYSFEAGSLYLNGGVTGGYGIGSSGDSADIFLGRDAANVLGIRAAASTPSVTNRTYGIYESATVGEFIETGYDRVHQWFFLRSMTNNSGALLAAHPLNISTSTNRSLLIGTNNTVTIVNNLTNTATTWSSNHNFLVSQWFAPTNSTVNTNITVDFSIGVVDLYPTNSLSFTNFANLPDSNNASVVVFRIVPQLVNRAIVYPTLGGASFGVYCETNANSPMWGTLTQGSRYRLVWDAIGTNIAMSISEWK